MVENAEFLLRFHSLDGITVGEKRKNLFLLLKDAGDGDNLDFATLQPKTFLEEQFKVEILLHFRKTSDLLDILKSENPVLIARILKGNDWFINDILKNISSEDFVGHILPNVSYNTKLKLMNKLVACLKCNQQANEYFKAIDEKYGWNLASKLLPSCQLELIISFIKKKRFNPTPKQLLIIVKRNTNMIEEIFELLGNMPNIYVDNLYKSVINYLARYRNLLFLKLHKRFNWSFRVGWRITEKLVRINKQDVMDNPTIYYRFLHNKQIAKTLHHDFKYVYYKLFPNSLENFEGSYNYIFSLLETLPPRIKSVDLLLSTFEEKYGSCFWEHPNYITESLLEMLSPNERRHWVKDEYKPLQITQDKWMCYSTIDKSIPYFKNRISLSSNIQTRKKLVGLLVKTCKVNSDKVALMDACNYIRKQHFNDNFEVRTTFLKVLKNNFELQNLSTEHWQLINELITIFNLNNETFDLSLYFIEKYVYYCLLNNLPIIDQLKLLMKSESTSLNIIQNEPKYEKQCLLAFLPLSKQVFQESNLREWNVRYLYALLNWNKRNPKDQMEVPEECLASLKQTFCNHKYSWTEENILKFYLRTNYDEDFLKIYFNLERHYSYEIEQLSNWLNCVPLIVLQNLTAVTKLIFNSYCKRTWFWRNCKKYSHLGIPEKIVNVCLKEFQDKHTSSNYFDRSIVSVAIDALSNLSCVDDFLQLIAPFYPTDLQANPKTEEGQTLYNLQQSIGNYIQNIRPFSRAMESILFYCKGDYLKLVRKSLYFVSDNMNENTLPQYFDELMIRAVSVRKHSMHLTFRVLDKTRTYIVLNHFMSTERNPSLRKFIFRGCFNMFIKNPSEHTWELVKLNFKTVDADDQEAIEILMQLEKVPHEYLVPYIIFTWDILHNIPDPDGAREHNKTNLLNSISTETIQMLPKTFYKDVINRCFYTGSCTENLTYHNSRITAFVCKYIVHCKSKSEQKEYLRETFEIVKNFIGNSWYKQECRNSAADFMEEFCQIFLHNESSDREILLEFVELWKGLFKIHEYFDEYLHLQFTLIYSEKLSISEIASKLMKLCNLLTETYGNVIIGMFFKNVKLFARYFFKFKDGYNEDVYDFIESIIEDDCITSALLATLLLNEYKSTLIKTKDKYCAIVEMLEQKQNPVIQIYLYNHLGGATELYYNI